MTKVEKRRKEVDATFQPLLSSWLSMSDDDLLIAVRALFQHVTHATRKECLMFLIMDRVRRIVE